MSTTIVGKSTECYMLFLTLYDILDPTYAGSYGFVLGELENQHGRDYVASRLKDGSFKIVKVSVTVVAESE